MGTTPNKAMRFPDPTQLGMGPDDFAKMAYDLDGAYTAEDTVRAAALYRPRAKVAQTTTGLSVAKNTFVTANYDVVYYDTLGQANLGTNNQILTCKKAGLYFCLFAISLSIGSTLGTGGNMFVGIGKNGTVAFISPLFRARRWSNPNDSGAFTLTAHTMFNLAVNDTIQGAVFWTGSPAGPFSTTLAELSFVCVNNT